MSRAENLLEVKPDSLSQEAVVKVASRMGRRSFLKTTASASVGLCIAGSVPELLSAAARRAAATSSSFAPNAFVRIVPDDTVTVISGHSEMGQGIYTSMAMVLNEELEADWSNVKVESAPVDPAYNHTRSEEHTSELQSRLHLVCRLLLEKKKNYLKPTFSYLPAT